MAKKNFLQEGDIRLYPESRDLNKKWFVKWKYLGVIKMLYVPHKATLEKRLLAANDLIKKIEKNPKNPSEKPPLKAATVYTDRIFKKLYDRANRLDPKSVQSYSSQIKNLDKYCKANGYRSITKEVAKKFIDWMIADGYHPITIGNHLVTFSTFFNSLKKEKIVRNNPFEDIDRVHGESEVRSHFTRSELKAVKQSLINDGKENILRACMYLYYLLCRPKELRYLKVRDIDFENWTIKISWTIGKKKRTRFVLIPDGLRQWMIDNKIEEYNPNFYLCGKTGLPEINCASANYFSSKFTKTLRDLGFDETYVLYSMKNTGAMIWWKAGIDIFIISRQIGHLDIKTTQIYFKSMGVLDFAHVSAIVPTF